MIPSEVFEQALRQLLAPVAEYLADAAVSEIMINGPREIFVERAGMLTRTNACFASAAELGAALLAIAQYVGRPLDALHPILEGRLPDGSRVEALLPPLAPDGPAVAIRRFSKHGMTPAALLELGALTPHAAQFLAACVTGKQNIIVAGGTGSGKTSLLNALSSFIPDGERIVVIEDARELQLQKQHVVQLEARPMDAHGRGRVSIADLFKATLRLRPDRIVIGEIRGGEALDLIQAMTSGHGGCLSTLHATYPRDTLNRLETLALLNALELPLFALRTQIASAVNIIVQTARLQDGGRGITHISELAGLSPENAYVLRDIFVRSYVARQRAGKITTRLVATGCVPECAERLVSAGLELPSSVWGDAQDAEKSQVAPR